MSFKHLRIKQVLLFYSIEFSDIFLVLHQQDTNHVELGMLLYKIALSTQFYIMKTSVDELHSLWPYLINVYLVSEMSLQNMMKSCEHVIFKYRFGFICQWVNILVVKYLCCEFIIIISYLSSYFSTWFHDHFRILIIVIYINLFYSWL